MNDSTELTTREPHTDLASREGARHAKQLTRVAPAVDIFEDTHGITLYADLPGVPREKLDVRVQDGSLSIEAEAV
ncbi:MAG: Hsp20/alpha crystallin family protein, partial [Paraburkholderia tropica]